MIDPAAHFGKLLGWLDMESQAELTRMAQRRRRAQSGDAERTGEVLLDMAISDQAPGVGGRLLLTFVKRNRELGLPWNRMRVGAPVAVFADSEEPGEPTPGVVSSRTGDRLQVAVSEWPFGDRFRIELSADEVTRKKHRQAVKDVMHAEGRLLQLRELCLGQRSPRFEKRLAPKLPRSEQLNDSQWNAVCHAMSGADLAIIHGPPGTGKTTTVVELVRQLIAHEESVLATAPSNAGVDNLVMGLVGAGLRCVRLGHPARVMQDLQSHTLDYLVANHENMKWVKSLLRESEDLFRQAGRYTRAKPRRNQRRELRDDARQLKDQARELERQAVKDVLADADVICTTSTLDEQLLSGRHFDWVIMDEACQSTEPGSWVPIRRCDRIVLAGDHCQLPPTVISDEAKREGFGVSLMERLIEMYPEAGSMLEVQYRMHEQIMTFSSREFYDDRLTAASGVAGRTLIDLPSVQELLGEVDTESVQKLARPITFIDTAGADFDEELEPDGESRRNPKEAQLVLKKVAQLVELGLASRDIAVIAPYAAQVRLLRQNRQYRDLEIDTVDGFQGREKEAVVMTLVRSNRNGEIGFLADERRMNVALTRARRKLIVVGDSSTLGNHEFYQRLLEYFESCGAYQSVWEEPLDG